MILVSTVLRWDWSYLGHSTQRVASIVKRNRIPRVREAPDRVIGNWSSLFYISSFPLKLFCNNHLLFATTALQYSISFAQNRAKVINDRNVRHHFLYWTFTVRRLPSLSSYPSFYCAEADPKAFWAIRRRCSCRTWTWRPQSTARSPWESRMASASPWTWIGRRDPLRLYVNKIMQFWL